MRYSLFILLSTIFLLLVNPVNSWAQPPVNPAANPQPGPPDCIFFVNLALTGASGGTAAVPANVNGFDNRTLGCQVYTFAYQATATSGTFTSIDFQSATGAVSPGTFATWAGTVDTGVNPNTNQTRGTTTFSTGCASAMACNVDNSWLRILVTRNNFVGTLNGVLYGYRTAPVVVEATATIMGPIEVEGCDAAGAAQTCMPLPGGGTDESGNAQSLRLNASGQTIPANVSSAAADGISNTNLSPTGAAGGVLYPRPLLHLFNGTTWDRVRGNTLGQYVQGAVATGGNLSTSPVQPVVAGGVFGGIPLARYLRVDTDGRVEPPYANTLLADAATNLPSIPVGGAGTGSGDPLTYVAYPYGFNATDWDRRRTASLANFNVASVSTGINSIGAALGEKGSRWSKVSAPAEDSQATASIAAEAGVRHVADCISFSWVVGTGTVTATNATVVIRDGATGAGTIIWEWTVGVTVQVNGQGVQAVQPHSICGLNLTGTTNTAMTAEFSAGVANTQQAVSLSGFNVN